MALNDVFDGLEHDQMIIECFRQMWQYSADLMFIMAVEPDGEFSLYDNNPASRKTMGISPDTQIHRMNLRETWGDEIVEGLYATYTEAIRARKPISLEQHAIREDGSEGYFDTLFVPIFDKQGEPIFICGVSRDITTIKQAERIASAAQAKLEEYNQALEEINQRLDTKVQERTAQLEKARQVAEEATEAKSSFLAKMSHEIRTPINAVIGLSRLTLKTPLRVEQQDYLEKIQDAGETLLGIVNDVLDFSKLEAGKLNLEHTRFNPEDVLIRAVTMCLAKAHAKGLEIIVDLDPSVPDAVMGDPLRLQQILINLVANAVKFTSSGWVYVKADYLPAADTGTLRCVVRDSGIGISLQQQESLFQSFSQADNSMSRKYGGTGLGLAITKQLCEAMNGAITLESVLDAGTAFTVTLPIPSVGDLRKACLPAAGEYKALVVDHLPLSRGVLSAALARLNIAVDEATDIHQASALLNQRSDKPDTTYDIIFIDWSKAVASAPRRLLQLNTSCPMVVMASLYDRQEIQLYQDAPLTFLEKPVSPRSLAATVHTLLQHQPAGAEPYTANKTIVTPNFSGRRILLAEDNPINAQVALGYLNDTAVTVDTAENGIEVLDKLAQHAYDLVLMDIQMPDMDGLTATRHIRQTMGLTKLPIIAMTAHAMFDAEEKSLAAGMNEHVCKPVEPMVLYEVLKKYLPDKRSTNTIEEDIKKDSTPNGCLPAELLAIDALDVTRAVRNMGGKTELYLSLVDKFRQRYRLHLPALRQLIQQRNCQALAHEVHSLKSSVAYVGAFDLSDSCAELESLLNKPGQIPDSAAILCNQLANLVDELLLVTLRRQADTPVSRDFSRKNLYETLLEILPLLETSNFLVEEYFGALQELAANTDYVAAVSKLKALVDDVEYEAAVEHLKQLLPGMAESEQSAHQ